MTLNDEIEDMLIMMLYPYKAEYTEANRGYRMAKDNGNDASARVHADMIYSIIFETSLHISGCFNALWEDVETGKVPESETEKAKRILKGMREHYTKANCRLRTLAGFQQYNNMTNSPKTNARE
ncbi:MAG: hypothetical protein Q7S06_02555 [Nanoarchaeota archaeon]|nr:hypothetical protein [Nanoarchaeota archaeon]